MFKIDKENLIGFEIKTVHNLLKRDFDKSLIHDKFKNLTGAQKWIIGYLSEHEGQDVFQRDLEEEFSIRRSTATGILQLMENLQCLKWHLMIILNIKKMTKADIILNIVEKTGLPKKDVATTIEALMEENEEVLKRLKNI